ncbi:hypothetical protein ACJX0J_018079, partial [Zea mays]
HHILIYKVVIPVSILILIDWSTGQLVNAILNVATMGTAVLGNTWFHLFQLQLVEVARAQHSEFFSSIGAAAVIY